MNDRCYSIYYHKNKINGKLYIGLTKDVKKRWTGKGTFYEGCTYFSNAIQKYGWDNFEHEVLIENLTQEEAECCEIFLIDKYQTTNSKYGYNISRGGRSGNGLIGEKNPASIKLYQYSLEGEFIQEWACLSNAARQLNIVLNDIIRCCKNMSGEENNGYKQAGGYIWSYDKYDSVEPYKGRTIKKSENKVIYKIDMNTLEIVEKYDNIYQIPDDTPRKRIIERIRYACRGKIKSSDNYYWCYEEDYYDRFLKNPESVERRNLFRNYKVKVFNSVTNELLHIYNSAKECSEQMNIPIETIYAKISGGYQAKYLDSYTFVRSN